jgi:hypothetical protein
MNTAKQQAENIINNAVVMDFLRNEALEKVASEMSTHGYTCTAKGVDILTIKHKNIADRVNQYISVGVVGCLMAKYSV